MGNCAASRLAGGSGDDDDTVALCRDRKRLLKATLHRRFALADAHHRYTLSLHSLAAALSLFVARYSAPDPMLITLPPPSPEPKVAPQAQAQDQETALPQPSVSPPSSPSSSSTNEEERVEAEGGHAARGYFFSHAAAAPPPPPPPPPPTVFGWDFFLPFDEEALRAVREQEGIPELEEVEEAVPAAPLPAAVTAAALTPPSPPPAAECVPCEMVEGGEEKGVTVVETPARERELLEALRGIEEHFERAFQVGKEISRMLEVSSVQLNSGVDEAKDNSSKLIQAITWSRSTSSLSSCSSYRSNLASSSKESSWSGCRSELFDSNGGMSSGSHSQTLQRLYAWEKKLFEEVKTGENTRQAYEKKCLQLRNQDAKGADSRSVDKTRTLVRDLYTRIWVALRSVETISKKIEQVRDEELQPQLIELLQGLMKTWKIMLESHETQKQIMFEVTSFACPTFGRFCSDSQRCATLKLESELLNWRTCFMSYIVEQRGYIEALHGWLSKFFIADIEYYSRGRSSTPSYGVGAPTLLLICHDWLDSCRKLPDKAVSYAMKGFIKDMRALWGKQGDEQQQKRKVDSLSKELDRRVLALHKAENRVLEAKLSDLKPEPDLRQRVEYLAERKDSIDMFRKKLEAEKIKHQDYVKETQNVTLNGFTSSLAKVFETLSEFSKDSLKMYDELLMQYEKAKVAGHSSCIEVLNAVVDER